MLICCMCSARVLELWRGSLVACCVPLALGLRTPSQYAGRLTAPSSFDASVPSWLLQMQARTDKGKKRKGDEGGANQKRQRTQKRNAYD